MINECEFVNVYNIYKPNGYIRFIYKYFSTNTHHRDMRVSNTITTILISLFAGGFVSTMITKENSKMTAIFTIIYGILLVVLCICVLIAILMNNRRITNIANKLGISREEYIKLVVWLSIGKQLDI